ncbi:hypothetical protein [Pseudochelatococcus contaminans]|uniref:ABC-type Fe3+ transport system substrate-binding protein n=1 Tax=Pseudochelatococcus contaminans TaxID=1538103 RepID=A0A7W5Z622_9HYPH|nr:hypothetical protein [Pseudochelatococcus contaminans]MBB3810136.1 ABC-type Fe3+ transport system substrate-binding protein [Pseudochelatococcus contaminans]
MTLSRRALGGVLIGGAIAGTGAYVALKDNPLLRGLTGNATELKGFVGGEKQPYLANPRVADLLRKQGITLHSTIAGSVEMVRQKSLIDQQPDFLWPSSSVMTEMAKMNGLPVVRDQTILNTPIVIYSWSNIVDGLVANGLVTRTPDGHYEIDTRALIAAIAARTPWKDLGVPSLYGAIRISSTDPNRSNSGFMFAGLVLSALTGSVPDAGDLNAHFNTVKTVFDEMGFKSPSSGKLFDQYIAGGPGSEPMIVGYENQLVEWAQADPKRWERIQSGRGTKPVLIYPRPTVYSAHPLLALGTQATPLIDALLSPELQAIAWTDHGFRGPLGEQTATTLPGLAELLIPEVSATLPLPGAPVMLDLIQRLDS